MRIGACIWHAGFGPTIPTAPADGPSFAECAFGTRSQVSAWENLLDAGLDFIGRGPPARFTPKFSAACLRDLKRAVSTGVGALKNDGQDERRARAMRSLVKGMRTLEHEAARAGGLRDATSGAELQESEEQCSVPD